MNTWVASCALCSLFFGSLAFTAHRAQTERWSGPGFVAYLILELGCAASLMHAIVRAW